MSEDADRLSDALDRLLDGEQPEKDEGEEPTRDPRLIIAAELRAALRPVQPDAAFRAQLKDTLLREYVAGNVRAFPRVTQPAAESTRLRRSQAGRHGACYRHRGNRCPDPWL